MKIAKIVLLLYNSILVFTLATIGFFTQSYQDWTPIILLLPVGVYFNLSLVNQITKISHFAKNPKVRHLKNFLKTYSLGVILLFIFANLVSGFSAIQSTMTLIFLPLILSFSFDLFSKESLDQFRLKKIITFNKLFNPDEKEEKEGKKAKKGKEAKKQKKTKSKNQAEKNSEIYLSGEVDSPEYLDLQDQIEEGLVPEGLEDMFDVKDQKRRQFLRIVGGGGVSMFLMLFVFQQKASAAFFGSAPGPGIVGIKDIAGDKIDPAEKQPTDGYNISEIDDTSSPAYYGFIHKEGAWYIAKEDSAGAYRYVSGASGFSTNWTNRASLTYDYFDNIF